MNVFECQQLIFSSTFVISLFSFTLEETNLFGSYSCVNWVYLIFKSKMGIISLDLFLWSGFWVLTIYIGQKIERSLTAWFCSQWAASIDPYVILTYRTQEHKSTVQKGASLANLTQHLLIYVPFYVWWLELISVLWIPDSGSKPQWNENFLFTVSDSTSELNLKIMDKDNFTQDDFLGEATWVKFSFNFYIFLTFPVKLHWR